LEATPKLFIATSTLSLLIFWMVSKFSNMCVPYAPGSMPWRIDSFRIKNERRVTPGATQLVAHMIK
jgi:hypothetical protein